MSLHNHQYQQLEQEHESYLRAKENDVLFSDYSHLPRSWSHRWIYWVLILSLGLSVFLNIITLFWRQEQDLDTICSLHTSQNESPLMQDIKIKYSSRKFTGSFLNFSIYTEAPSPKVDQAWLALGTEARHYVVPEHLASNYGLNPSYLKYAEASGGGYPVLFEFEHHLHCVDLLRQSLFWNYNYYLAQGRGPFSNPPEIIHRHVSHCVDILRQVIMCQPDTGVFGQFWVNEINGPFVDFHTNHKCKNFEDMKSWVDSHQVSADFLKTARVVQRPGDIALDKIP